MVSIYKYVRFIMLASSIVVYSCYLYAQEAEFNGDFGMQNISDDTKTIYYVARVYAEMLHHGMSEKQVQILIQEKYKERPRIGDKIWEKVKEISAAIPQESSHAF
jgi:hypothetical protein